MGFFFLNTWIFPNKTKFCLLYSERNVKKTIEKVSLWNINLWSGYFKAFNISKGRSNFCSSSFSNNENNLLQKSTPSELSRSFGVLWWHDSMLFSIISLWQWSTALSFISRFWQEPSRFHAAVAIQMFSLAPNFLTDFSTEPISKWNESNLDSNRSKWDFKSFFFFFFPEEMQHQEKSLNTKESPGKKIILATDYAMFRGQGRGDVAIHCFGLCWQTWWKHLKQII